MDHQEKTNIRQLQEEDSDQDDAVSLSDLPTHNNQPSESSSTTTSTLQDDTFDFSFTFHTPINNTNHQNGVTSYNNHTIINKIKPIDPFDALFDNNNYKINKSNSSGLLHSRKSKSCSSVSSGSLQSMKLKSCRKPDTGSYRLNYSSSSSRRHWVFFGYGLAKIPTKMELSDIKKRQSSRRNPAPMFPVVAASGGGADNGKPAAAGSRRHHWVLITSMLAKVTSFSCVSPPL